MGIQIRKNPWYIEIRSIQINKIQKNGVMHKNWRNNTFWRQFFLHLQFKISKKNFGNKTDNKNPSILQKWINIFLSAELPQPLRVISVLENLNLIRENPVFDPIVCQGSSVAKPEPLHLFINWQNWSAFELTQIFTFNFGSYFNLL